MNDKDRAKYQQHAEDAKDDVAIHLYGVPFREIDGEEREIVKKIVFGMVYRAGGGSVGREDG